MNPFPTFNSIQSYTFKRIYNCKITYEYFLPSYLRPTPSNVTIGRQQTYQKQLNFPSQTNATASCLKYSFLSNPSLCFQFSAPQSQHCHFCHTDLVDVLFLHQPTLAAIQQNWLNQCPLNSLLDLQFSVTQNSHHTTHFTYPASILLLTFFLISHLFVQKTLGIWSVSFTGGLQHLD